jgi:hypothetical protein
MKIPLQATLLLASLAPAAAYPYGAGACPEAIPAVGSFHLFRTPGDSGGLDDGGLTVVIDGTPLDSAEPLGLFTNIDYTVTLAGSSFRGFLFRLASPLDGVDAMPNVDSLAPEAGNSDVQQAAACNSRDVAGVTHVINDVKTEVSATLNADTAYEALFDVTVSIYEYLSRRFEKVIWSSVLNFFANLSEYVILLSPGCDP